MSFRTSSTPLLGKYVAVSSVAVHQLTLPRVKDDGTVYVQHIRPLHEKFLLTFS